MRSGLLMRLKKGFRMKKTYIKVKPLPNIAGKKPVVEKSKTDAEIIDKIARLYALAQELHVKIGG